MAFSSLSRFKFKSLNTEIAATEGVLIYQHQHLAVGFGEWIIKVKQCMTAPANLILAGGCGFVLGELSQSYPHHSAGQSPQTVAVVKQSGLSNILNSLAFVHRIYSALPVVLLIKDCIANGEMTTYT